MPTMPTPPALVAALAAASLALAGCSGPEPEKLKIGVAYDHPGLALMVTSEAVGLDTAVARHLARDLGAQGRDEVSFIDHPARSRFAAVAGGTVRFALGADPVPDRYRAAVVTVGPYLLGGLQLATRAGGPADLRGRRVCVASGSPAEEALPRLVPGALPAPSPTISTCLTDVVEGRADAALEDGIVLRGYAAGPAYRALRIQPRRLTTTEHSVLVARKNTDLCRQLTASLRRMVSSGTWDRAVTGDLVTTGILHAAPPRPTVHGCD